MVKDQKKSSQKDKKKDEKHASLKDREQEITSLKEQLKEKEETAEKYFDRMLRIQADLENYRKRVSKETEDYRKYSNLQLLKKLLDITDNFERALGSLPDDSETRTGLTMIFEQIQGILREEGISPQDPLGEKFDPYHHEAEVVIETDEHPENTIIEVVRKGYSMGEKIIRPSVVRISKLPDTSKDGTTKEQMKSSSEE